MLKAHEELYHKELSPEVEGLLRASNFDDNKKKARDKTRVVDFRVPHNSAVQIYDYNKKKHCCCVPRNLSRMGTLSATQVISG